MVARCTRRWLPVDDEAGAKVVPKHLTPGALDSPAPAHVERGRARALRIGDTIETMLAAVLTVIRNRDINFAREIRAMDDKGGYALHHDQIVF